MNIYIIRNAQRFGPYDEKTLLSYVNNGQILKQDKGVCQNSHPLLKYHKARTFTSSGFAIP